MLLSGCENLDVLPSQGSKPPRPRLEVLVLEVRRAKGAKGGP